MNKVSILVGKRNGEISYWRVFANRKLAEHQKTKFETFDTLNKVKGWKYFIQDETVFEKVC